MTETSTHGAEPVPIGSPQEAVALIMSEAERLAFTSDLARTLSRRVSRNLATAGVVLLPILLYFLWAAFTLTGTAAHHAVVLEQQNQHLHARVDRLLTRSN